MPPPTSDRTVVLVDDCRDHCLLTERALRQMLPATRYVTLENGDAAIRHLDGCIRQGGRPELLLLDWRMPGRSGEDVLAWARSQPKLTGLPILVLSGIAFPEDRRRAAELGATGYLVKPSNLDGYDTLAKQVEGWRTQLTAEMAPTAATVEASPENWGRRSARTLRDMVRGWVRAPWAQRDARKAGDYVEVPSDQLTADLVRLCRAQGISPREILREIPAHSPPARQRRTIIRGLARRGWDTHELAEIFPLTPASIRLLVRRKGKDG